MNINSIDLNLLRLFAAIYASRSVSRAAAALDISQPAASNGLTRLRALFGDPLFVRIHGGVRPTAAADELAVAVTRALQLISEALQQSESFDPARSKRVFRAHLSDIGEARFLPELMAHLRQVAPAVTIECQVLSQEQISAALGRGELDVAFGYLPAVQQTEHTELIRDRYALMVRAGHPATQEAFWHPGSAGIRSLEFVAVSAHSETLRILETLDLTHNVRLFAMHFLALPAIVRATDLAVIMPQTIAREFAADGRCVVIDAWLPTREFVVSLHWHKRRHLEPAHRWLREVITACFPARLGKVPSA